ncbi:hypothetical protein MRB53_011823 [Persea americana]|uniref:Uncharacterized protein n=1 Tax=Persea americana TaxID=3435 RepID=A0ACC2LVL3_PERAE|nr:hypothetical protein MRB53_011823 [Persea americana]
MRSKIVLASFRNQRERGRREKTIRFFLFEIDLFFTACSSPVTTTKSRRIRVPKENPNSRYLSSEFSLSITNIRFHQANRSHFQSTFGFDLFGIDDTIAQCDCFCSPQFSPLCGILELGFDPSRRLNAFMMEFIDGISASSISRLMDPFVGLLKPTKQLQLQSPNRQEEFDLQIYPTT